jgi:protein-disulfide isomerase-like protein with CxxC motif
MAPVHVTFFIDPGCPFGYSAWPAISALRWRFGDGLRWRTVMIGLSEDPSEYVAKGFSPLRMATSQLGFRRHGMPFAPQVKQRLWATSPACRAIVAVRREWPEQEWAALRALQFAQFCSPLLLDSPADLRMALSVVPGIDADRAVSSIDDAEVWEDYEADRALARSAAGTAAQAQGKTAGDRFTAPSLIFTAGADSLVVGGFQPLAAYDLAVANLAPELERREAPEDPVAALAAFPDGLTTAEAGAILGSEDAEVRLLEAMADGHVARAALGDGALWQIAVPAGRFTSPTGRSSVRNVTYETWAGTSGPFRS